MEGEKVGSSRSESIAIVGSGCRFPGGATSPSALWDLLQQPRDVSQDISHDRFEAQSLYHPDGTHHSTTNVKQAYLLEEDVRVFDAAFFNISPTEADSMDPQQRLLLETVYEALEAGGHTIESLRGSDTAVYVGTMSVDYNDTLARDLSTAPMYFGTGINRAIISNRVSYFFDWRGPSMTIDTACSSSLIAVHQGVNALRTGESRVAVACGTQVILEPEAFVVESKLGMLSPTSRSRMWDAEADGYARGEGTAAIVLKRLSDAIADGDHVECLIRATGANQDGHSVGLTVPNSDAQAALIRQTYAKAGLDPKDPRHRPQFFEAHGTGTKAGDPREAAAIQNCFGGQGENESPLYVGSVKTVIGHTEGAAGLAGLLKGSGMIQRGFIPPNLLFDQLNPAIEPYYQGLHVPTVERPWPKLAQGVPRRVSVNSFGFGGSNAHAILEEFRKDAVDTNVKSLVPEPEPERAPFIPFVFSAVSEASLVGQLQAYSNHLKAYPDINLSDLAWTLQSRRSQFPVKSAFSAATVEQLLSKIDEKLAEAKRASDTNIGVRSASKSAAPRVLGIFTGQGAQWAAMGERLIRSSEFVRRKLEDLERSLATLPPDDRPQWHLVAEILAGDDISRISEAELSQPLCTAIQIVLVDLLQRAGITFSAVVGHSSGEIAAAYAAGFYSAHDAIRIAYYRGFHAYQAGSPNSNQKGAMLAVGTSWEDAQELIELRAFRGRLAIAAHNSSASVTLSGDADAVIHAKKVFDEEKKFARLLKVDTAYHSHHMLPCAEPYIRSLRTCGIQINRERIDPSCSWFSSVFPSGKAMRPGAELQDIYWRDNMTNAVLFAEAIKDAVACDQHLSLALEVGPHPALRGPAVQNISECRSTPLPYSGLLSRRQDDIQAFSNALGFIWTHFGVQGIDLQSYETAMSTKSSGVASRPKLLVGLPSYSWNHTRKHWHESRRSRKMREQKQVFHELLGIPSPDSTAYDMRWTNVLKVSEIPWLEGHQLQGQIVFPAAGHIALALEAARSLAADRNVELFEIHNLTVPKAIIFDDNANSAVETLVTLTAITNSSTYDQQHRRSSTPTTTADFSCYACPVTGPESEMELKSRASVKIVFGSSSFEALSSTPLEASNMSSIDAERFYSSISKTGYEYTGAFRTMSSMKRRLKRASALVSTYPYTDADVTSYLVHPTYLDVAIQTTILAYSAPGDERLWSLHVPTSMGSIRINPELCASLPTSGSLIPVCAVLDETEYMCASIDMLSPDAQQAMIQIEGLAMQPFAPATEVDDRPLFSYTKWDYATPNGASIVRDMRPSPDEIELASVCERMCYYYLRKWKAEITDEEWKNGQPHHSCLRNYVNHTLSVASSGRLSWLKNEWVGDTPDDIENLINKYPEAIDIKLLSAVGNNIPAAVRHETTILEHMLLNDMLEEFYATSIGAVKYYSFFADMMKQLAHRYPHARILEIGAGTGGATKSALESIGNTMSSYTYTDVSTGFFGQAAEKFNAYRDKMTFKVLDIEKAPAGQGFKPYSYDVVIASSVLHATSSLLRTLENTRQLLKPGGYLLLTEVTNNKPLRNNVVMGGLPGWWLGVHEGRTYSPTVSPGEWHSALKKTGFSGVDTITPEIDSLVWPYSVLSAQAIDDRVQFLRRPLGHHSTSIFLESVVILGAGSLESARIVEELDEQLRRFSGQITILGGLPTESEALTLSPMSTFINLVDIDSPIFKSMTAEKMDGLKRVFELAKTIVWITMGALVDEPYHQASIGFSRTMAHEAGHISLSHLDFSDLGHNVSYGIAEHLLRQCALDEWAVGGDQQRDQELLWSKEAEVFIDRGQMMVPRVVDNMAQNARLNSSRRAITKTVPIRSSDLSIAPSATLSPSLVQEPLSISLMDNENFVSIESSSLMALHIAAGIFLFLAMGKEKATQEPAVVLSTRNSCEVNSITRVALDANDVTKSADMLLIAVSSELLATSLLEIVSPGSRILIHCSSKHRFLAVALARQAAANDINVTFIHDEQCAQITDDPTWIKLSARTPKHALRRLLLPVKPTHFLDLTAFSFPCMSEIGLRIAGILPLACKQIDPSSLAQHQPLLHQSGSEGLLTGRLETAIANTRMAATSAASDQVNDLFVQPDRISDLDESGQITNMVRWQSQGEAVVQVRPLDLKGFFSQNKSYLLVGLTGELGRSACEWMVSQGAGCVCLTSREPAVDKTWLDSFKVTNTTIKVFSMDVTDKRSVERVITEIKSSCPRICGVINGAMVLRDSLFSNMSIDQMQQVLGPKIDGTNNLDEIFYDDKLDFFVLFSSAACVIGNGGQANYTAANGYINSFARKRRSRGLAASAVDIGQVVGIGYVENARQAVKDQLTKIGMLAISEVEYHQILAESILAGLPGQNDHEAIPAAVVTTGVRTYQEHEIVLKQWLRNPRFSHRIIKAQDFASEAEDQSKKTILPVREQLLRATSRDQSLEILIECFSAKLRMILQLRDSKIEPDTTLIQLGVDSLVAVEVRSWFLKELKVDMPVLKVVGGASVSELCQIALEKLPQDLLAGSEQKSGKPNELQSKPQMVVSGAISERSSNLPDSPISDIDSKSAASSTHLTSASSSSELQTNTARLSEPSPVLAAEEQPSRKVLKSEQISFGQSRFWFLRQLLEDQTTSNIACYYLITGHLRIGDLERGIRMVTARHEALRTSFVGHESEPDQAYQKVMNRSTLRLEHKQINVVEDVAVEYAKLKAHVFDLENGDVMRLVLLSLSSSSHFLLFISHHIILDGVTQQVFLSDLEKAYNGHSLGRPPRQYPEFSATQRQAYEKGEMNNELRYWQTIFPKGEQPPVLPLLPMAQSRSRAAMKDYDVHQVHCRLDPHLATRIKRISREQRATPFHFYLAVFKVMLFCFTDAQDLTIGIADANRHDSDVMGSIGFFLNLLTLRFRRDPDQRFANAIIEARDTTYAALENSRLPFDVLLKELNVNRSSTHSPFFQAFIDYRQGMQEKHAWGNCQFEIQEAHPGRTAYDITLDVTDNATDAVVMLRTQKNLYDLTAANLLLETYVHMVNTLSNDALLSLEETPLFSEKQIDHAVKVGRGPDMMPSDWPETIPHRIDQIARENQNQIALMDGINRSLTYLDMSNRIEAIGEALQNAGLRFGSRMLVFQQAASDWVCSMLAVMRVGGIYVPLDLRNPMPRLAAIANDCEPSAVLVDDTTVETVSQLNVSYALVINISQIALKPSARIPIRAQADSSAAILYTSGSTGTPKGIIVTHMGLRNEIEGYTKTWKLGAERVLQQSAYSFNHSSDQIYTGLVNGGMVYTVSWDKRGDPLEITKIIQEHSITYTKATPSEYLLWMQYGGDNLQKASRWRRAFGGGERLNDVILQEFADLNLPRLRVFNSYGPTEISISSTKREIEYREQTTLKSNRIPCGYSLPNYATYILDEQLKPLPAGMPGEIYIGGAGVSLGYLNNEELTRKHFVPDPFATPEYIANGWTRMYRTGDIGHLQDDGAMTFHCRMAGDTQIKVRGLRLELSDIESNILSVANGVLREAVVSHREGDPDFLVAHVVFAPQHDITDKGAFLEHLLSHLPLPQYMIPVTAIPLDQLPLTNHSKVDRRAIQELPLAQRARNIHEDVELTETMVQLKRIWRDVLGKDELGFDINRSTSFFAVGGNSLLVIRLQARIRQAFNVVIRLVELLGANTLGEMARKVEESSMVDPIDWDAETAPPSIPGFLEDNTEAQHCQRKTKTILITGGTGFLSKYILPQLAENPDISKIHCVAVREKSSEGARRSFSSPKIVSHTGDLSAPFLGLSENEFQALSREVDAILHLGAMRSFWDNYQVLRSSNVHSTKELAKLAAPNRIPIHYISTIGVLPWASASDTISAAAYPPPTDGTNGYVATKWASERILERSAATLGTPVLIYRFLPSSQQSSSQKALEDLVRLVDVAGKLPDFSGWQGRIDLIPANQAASLLCDSMLHKRGHDESDAAAQFLHYESPETLDVTEMSACIEERKGGEEGLERMPGLRWFGRIKALGFDYLITSQDASVASKAGRENGAAFVSRR